MKNFIYIISILVLAACGKSSDPTIHEDDHDHDHDHNVEEGIELVELTNAQAERIGLTTTAIKYRNMAEVVHASGSIEVPPQNEAIVTAFVGANVKEIKVIEGDPVRKGQVLGYLSHPNLLIIQTDYISALSELDYEKQNYERQQTLYDEKVGSGQQLQLAKAEYLAQNGTVKGLEAQLKILGLSPSSIAKGNIVESVPIKSPIEGYIQKVQVKTAQYVEPQTVMFEIINIHHIHADLMVFEKDVIKVKKGQKIRVRTEVSDEEVIATIYAVGKSFESSPKAVHIHAELENKNDHMLPGMYIKGEILVSSDSTTVLPAEALVRTEDGFMAFRLHKKGDHWSFEPTPVETGTEENGYHVVLLNDAQKNAKFAANNAYYLLSEWKKDEADHGHSH